mmetsp:Transcript_56569/g.138845  ORF Transcript_56569/g.138845 Transcript_56569/m.138845 type:complete len:393 (-) Transcript_56569:291-1469(-)
MVLRCACVAGLSSRVRSRAWKYECQASLCSLLCAKSREGTESCTAPIPRTWIGFAMMEWVMALTRLRNSRIRGFFPLCRCASGSPSPSAESTAVSKRCAMHRCTSSPSSWHAATHASSGPTVAWRKTWSGSDWGTYSWTVSRIHCAMAEGARGFWYCLYARHMRRIWNVEVTMVVDTTTCDVSAGPSLASSCRLAKGPATVARWSASSSWMRFLMRSYSSSSRRSKAPRVHTWAACPLSLRVHERKPAPTHVSHGSMSQQHMRMYLRALCRTSSDGPPRCRGILVRGWLRGGADCFLMSCTGALGTPAASLDFLAWEERETMYLCSSWWCRKKCRTRFPVLLSLPSLNSCPHCTSEPSSCFTGQKHSTLGPPSSAGLNSLQNFQIALDCRFL